MSKAKREPLDDLLARLTRLDSAATPAGAWSVMGNTLYIGDQWWAMPGRIPDADLAVAARCAVPRLVAEIRRLLGTDTPHGRCAACGFPKKPDGCCSRDGCCDSD